MKTEVGNNTQKVSQGGSLGEILLNSQKSTEADIEKIVVLQKKRGLYFGEAVVDL